MLMIFFWEDNGRKASKALDHARNVHISRRQWFKFCLKLVPPQVNILRLGMFSCFIHNIVTIPIVAFGGIPSLSMILIMIWFSIRARGAKMDPAGAPGYASGGITSLNRGAVATGHPVQQRDAHSSSWFQAFALHVALDMFKGW